MSAITQRRPTVMIVDDDAHMRAALRGYIEREGFGVIEHESATRARQAAVGQIFDAVILDKEMPGLDGLEFLVFLHGQFPSVPVVFITAFGGPAVAQEAFARGAASYLEKPFRLGDLVMTLRRLTRLSCTRS